jgi:hypothetical protein
MNLMECFVRHPMRMAKWFGWATTVIFLVAVLVFQAPAWVLLLICIGPLVLFAQLSDRGDRIARERNLR